MAAVVLQRQNEVLVTGDLSGPQDLKYLIAGSLQKKSLLIHVLKFLKKCYLGMDISNFSVQISHKDMKKGNQIWVVIEYTGVYSGLPILGFSVNTVLQDIFE